MNSKLCFKILKVTEDPIKGTHFFLSQVEEKIRMHLDSGWVVEGEIKTMRPSCGKLTVMYVPMGRNFGRISDAIVSTFASLRRKVGIAVDSSPDPNVLSELCARDILEKDEEKDTLNTLWENLEPEAKECIISTFNSKKRRWSRVKEETLSIILKEKFGVNLDEGK